MLDDRYYNTPLSYRVQKTLKSEVQFRGVSLHRGQPSTLRILPAPPNFGIQLQRTDLPGAAPIRAHFDWVVETKMCTTLGDASDPRNRIATVEHLIAALFAMGVTNAEVWVDSEEVPILDGSSSLYVEAVMDVGVELQPYSTPTLKIHKPIRRVERGSVCELLPRDHLRVTTSIDFPHPQIGLQTCAVALTPRIFRESLSQARTFGFQSAVDSLRAMNLAQGASLENVLAFDEKGILNPEGARFEDECVRHKLLDAVGDVALCTCWIEGELVSFRGGHSIHLALLKALKDCRDHWEIVPAERLTLSLPQNTVTAQL